MSRNPETNRQIKEERREAILSAALHLFAKKGLAAAKSSDIAAAAGISQGLLYHYFTSKEEIFTTLIRNAFEKMNEACVMLEGLSISPKEKVQMAVEKLLEGLGTHPSTAETYLLIAQATASGAIPEEARQAIRTLNRTPYEVMTRIFAAGQASGVFRQDPPEVLAQMFWTSFTGLSIYKALHPDYFIAPNPEVQLRMFLAE